MFECYEILRLFIENNVDVPDRSVDLVVNSLITNRFYGLAIEFLTREIPNERLMRLNLRNHIKLLLLYGENERSFALLEKLPLSVTITNEIKLIV